ncbi:hypothetical protein [Candidatus Magnetominusculus dajiuhuensis]|uniref:hypothetical protein n=1 Tax=Candidatus Magnetominusculus dajiuhuensis TaxID=3137712 RepID=UPI003B43B71B
MNNHLRDDSRQAGMTARDNTERNNTARDNTERDKDDSKLSNYRLLMMENKFTVGAWGNPSCH